MRGSGRVRQIIKHLRQILVTNLPKFWTPSDMFSVGCVATLPRSGKHLFFGVRLFRIDVMLLSGSVLNAICIGANLREILVTNLGEILNAVWEMFSVCLVAILPGSGGEHFRGASLPDWWTLANAARVVCLSLLTSVYLSMLISVRARH